MSKSKTIVISGINMVEGGIFTILDNCLQKISEYNRHSTLKIIALVPDASLFSYPNIEYIEFPKSKKKWVFRLYYEYYFFKKLSLKLRPDIWFSLHDVSPSVVCGKQFLYFHHPTIFYKATYKDWKFDYKIGVFSIFYKALTQINLKKNHTVFVQQHWIKDKFASVFKIKNCKVARPDFTETITTQKIDLDHSKTHFFFPSFPRTFKNFEIIFDAIALLDENTRQKTMFHFTTIKDNPSKYAQHLMKIYGHLHEVNFLPTLKRDVILSYYNAIDCLLFPSKLETWGLPISEAKSYQKPMFVARLPYAIEAVGNYEKVCFFNPTKPEELATLITQFINKTLLFEGNRTTFDTQDTLENWNDVFDFMLK
ncbi:MAG TPA: glycosyltransferase family 1 protein [Flavobacterium sp.]|nr:glycosyltransferase family 1 protein [Flavobacterium sp.]